MLIELRRFYEKISQSHNLFGGRGGGGDDNGPDKDADREGKEGKEGKDPFENFDFTRFRSSRPKQPDDSTPKSSEPTGSGSSSGDDDDASNDNEPPRTSRPRSTSGSSGRNTFGGFDFNSGQFSGFGGGGNGGTIGQLPQLRMPRLGRGAIALIILAVVIVLLLLLGPNLISFWTDMMWFQEVQQTGVFWVRFWQPLITFAIAFVIAFAVIMVNVSVARRFGPSGPVINTQDNPMAALLGGGVRFLNWAFVAAAVIISLFLAGAASSKWQTILFYLNAAPWTDKEPIYNNSVGFYVFDVPFISFLQGWAVGLFVVALIASLAIYFLRFTLAGQAFSFTPAIKTHASVLGAILLGLFAFGYQISNWDLVYSNRGRVYGTSATDYDAQFPANTILTFIVAAAAILLLANIFIRNTRRGVTLLVAASLIWLVGHILIAGVYPSVYQNFSVKPNELSKEQKYISNTIAMTRKAFGLELNTNVKEVPFQGTATLTQQDIQNNPYIEDNARLWDYDKLKGIYDLTQTLRRYYDFTDIDIDRYNLALGGSTVPTKTQVMIGARELDINNLQTQTWQSTHLQYTHGYGVQASPVNEVTTDGRPINLITQSFPFSSTILPVQQPRIYFGQGVEEQNYSIVGPKIDEIDYPFQSAEDVKFKYDGTGGVPLSNWFVKAAFAAKLGDFNLLISDNVTDDSRLIFRRGITERINEIAPFLTLDKDPYLVAAEGKLYFIQDAYTQTDLYPHSNPLNRLAGVSAGTIPNSINPASNYIRNSVKVVIDAYNGTTTFYLVDKPTIDPIAQTYANIYPDLFKPMSQMSAELKAHLRYPEDLFTVQTQVYSIYHVTDPTKFYNSEDLWQVPSDPRNGSSTNASPYEPYYLVTRLPGETRNEFVLINVFQPQQKVNLVSWMAARMDGDNYGQLAVYNFDPSVNIDGPAQFFSKIQALPDFSSQRALLNSGSSSLPPGPIIIIPVDKAILYIMPYYLQGSSTALPQLQFVAVGANDKVYVSKPGSDDDRTKLLSTALTEVFTRGQQVAVNPGQTGNGTTTPGASTTPATNPTSPPNTPATAPVGTPGAGAGTPAPTAASGPTVAPDQTASIADLVRSIKAHQDLATQAFAAGDTARGNAELKAADTDLARLNQLIGR
ncbi:MAG: UPF0182 family protein [Chloroflexi bacterium]|nr:UPF0182 family protein [Chloroflexota bacterium]OJV99764.1 MAG: hypothetical protein BGO39_12520 [Chloroflexi bacterium 54-19]